MRIKNRVFVLAICAVVTFAALACAPAKKPENPTPNRNVTVQDTAAYLADQANDVEGVEEAYVLLVGRTAFVGLNINKELDDNKVKKIKAEVADKLEKNRAVSEALVTSDPELIEQIRDVTQGRSTPDSIKDIYDRMKTQS